MLVTSSLCGQEIFRERGKIINSSTGKPVAYAHVYFKNKSRLAISNDRGEYVLTYQLQDVDSLVISCIGYATRTISFSQLEYEMILNPDVVTLNNIVITDLTAQEIVKRAIKVARKHYRDQEVSLIGFYWNATKEDTLYTRLQQQQVEWLFPQKTIRVGRVENYGDKRRFRLDEMNNFKETISYEHLLSARGFLNPDNLDMWVYSLKGVVIINGLDYYKVEATFKTQKDRVNHRAQLLINAENFALKSIEFEYLWKRKHFKRLENFWYNFKSATGRVEFFNHNGLYYPSYVKVVVTQSIHDLRTRKLLSRQQNYNEITLFLNKESDFHPLSIDAFEQALKDIKGL